MIVTQSSPVLMDPKRNKLYTENHKKGVINQKHLDDQNPRKLLITLVSSILILVSTNFRDEKKL